MGTQKQKTGGGRLPAQWAVWGALIAVYLVWSSTYLAIRFADESIPPFLMAAARFLISGILLFGFRKLRGDPAPTRLEWREAGLVGLFLLLGGNGGVVYAELKVPSGIAALLVGSAPLFMVLIDALRPRGERPHPRALAGVLIGFAGIALLVGFNGGAGGTHFDLLGILILLGASLSWALGSIYGRRARLPASPLLGTGMEMLVGGAGLLILGTLTGEWSQLNLTTITARSLWGLAYLVVFGSLVGFAAYTWLLRVAPITLVSTYAYVNPLLAIFVGNLLGAEPITPRTLLSALVIVSAVAIITSARASRPVPKVDQPFPVTGDD